MDDATLMRRVANDDRQAVALLYARYHGIVRRYASSRVADPEDVAQGTLIAAWRRAKTYDPKRGKLNRWIMGIAKHAVVDAIRHANCRPKTEPFGDREFPTEHPLPTDAPQEARAAMEKMNPALRRIIVAVAWGGYRGASIAEDLPLGTVKSSVNRAKRQARQRG